MSFLGIGGGVRLGDEDRLVGGGIEHVCSRSERLRESNPTVCSRTTLSKAVHTGKMPTLGLWCEVINTHLVFFCRPNSKR